MSVTRLPIRNAVMLSTLQLVKVVIIDLKQPLNHRDRRLLAVLEEHDGNTNLKHRSAAILPDPFPPSRRLRPRGLGPHRPRARRLGPRTLRPGCLRPRRPRARLLLPARRRLREAIHALPRVCRVPEELQVVQLQQRLEALHDDLDGQPLPPDALGDLLAVRGHLPEGLVRREGGARPRAHRALVVLPLQVRDDHGHGARPAGLAVDEDVAALAQVRLQEVVRLPEVLHQVGVGLVLERDHEVVLHGAGGGGRAVRRGLEAAQAVRGVGRVPREEVLGVDADDGSDVVLGEGVVVEGVIHAADEDAARAVEEVRVADRRHGVRVVRDPCPDFFPDEVFQEAEAGYGVELVEGLVALEA